MPVQSVLHFTAHFPALYPYNHSQPVWLLLWKATLGANTEVKHKHRELKQSSMLHSHYTVLGLLGLLNTQLPPVQTTLFDVRRPVGLGFTRALNGLITWVPVKCDPLNKPTYTEPTKTIQFSLFC